MTAPDPAHHGPPCLSDDCTKPAADNHLLCHDCLHRATTRRFMNMDRYDPSPEPIERRVS